MLKFFTTDAVSLKDSDFIGIFYCFSNFGAILIILLFFRISDWNRKSPKPHHIQPPNSGMERNGTKLRNAHCTSLDKGLNIRPLSDDVQCVFRSLVPFRSIPDLEPNPCFQTLLIISKTYHRIFNCNTSKRRPGQELPFIFFELRAPTCL